MKKIDEITFDNLKVGAIITKKIDKESSLDFNVVEISKSKIHIESKGNFGGYNSKSKGDYSKEEIISSEKWFIKD